MGGAGEHYHDVCRVDQRLCGEKGPAGLDDFFDPEGFLVFDNRHPGEQSHRANGTEIF
jgi:hypothetical protein